MNYNLKTIFEKRKKYSFEEVIPILYGFLLKTKTFPPEVLSERAKYDLISPDSIQSHISLRKKVNCKCPLCKLKRAYENELREIGTYGKDFDKAKILGEIISKPLRIKDDKGNVIDLKLFTTDDIDTLWSKGILDVVGGGTLFRVPKDTPLHLGLIRERIDNYRERAAKQMKEHQKKAAKYQEARIKLGALLRIPL
jgi:hypothetical protein